MTRVVLSVGSNLGDRLAWLQTVADRAGTALRAVSPVYETDPWGDLEQGPFLNAVLVVEDAERDERAWLRFAQESERAADRVRGRHWGPRTLDVDLLACYQLAAQGYVTEEVIRSEADLTLPHPLAHRRAFVMVPWLAVDPEAELTVAGQRRPVVELLAELALSEQAGVRRTTATLSMPRS